MTGKNWLRTVTQRWRRKLLLACLPSGLYFAKLGQQGRLGNQLFQYATLRTLAEQLGQRYYCPAWAGDELFDLADRARLRIPFRLSLPHLYWLQPTDEFERVRDHLRDYLPRHFRGKANLNGHPESERLFDPVRVRRWFQLRPQWAAIIAARYRDLDLNNTVSLHVRLRPPLNVKEKVVCQLPYYRTALEMSDCANVLVFSDDLPAARALLAPLLSHRNFIFQAEPNARLPESIRDYEDIHLMSLCRDNIICVSTYSWWGAWLNEHADKRVICPVPWFQYGCAREFPSPACDGWIRLHADGERAKQLVIEPRGTAEEQRAVIVSAQIWAEHLARELRVLWRDEPLPGCTVERVPHSYAPAASDLHYEHEDFLQHTVERAEKENSAELLAIPSQLAGYAPIIHIETSSPFRPAWMSLAEYRAACARWEPLLFSSINPKRQRGNSSLTLRVGDGRAA